MDRSIVGDVGFEVVDGAAMDVAVDDAVVGGVEDMQSIAEVVLFRGPVEGGGAVGKGRNL